jgi:SAM-dependent methyltransferase
MTAQSTASVPATAARASAEALTRSSWEYANRAFNRVKGDFAMAIRDGGQALPDEVLEELDLNRGSRLLHLMCNDGREAAYLSHAYGVHVVGVDFSPSAIAYAESLNDELRLGNDFVTEEALAYLAHMADEPVFDVAMLTLGSLRWVEDLPGLFDGLAQAVRPAGELSLWDFHPLVAALGSGPAFARDYPFYATTYLRSYGVVDYVSDPAGYRLLARRSAKEGTSFENPYRVRFSDYSFQALVGGAVEWDLWRLSAFVEYPFSWEERCLPWLVEDGRGKFVAPSSAPRVPLTFLMRFRRTEVAS